MIRVTFADDGSTCDLDDDTMVPVEGRLWTLRLRQLRGQEGVTVGGRAVTVETYQEQIVRLEGERDAEETRTALYEAIADTRRLAGEAEKARADAAIGGIAARLASAFAVVPCNNNGPRVLLRHGGVEVVRHHRALADMRLPDNVADAASIREDAIAALLRAIAAPEPMPPHVMQRDLQLAERGAFLDAPESIADEVEEHRITQNKLREAEAYAESLDAACDAEKARADAAEKRLADLQAWAKNASYWTAVARGRAWGELMARLDGKDGESK